MKIVSNNGQPFMQGWTCCAHCGKRMKYKLDVSIALTMLEDYELCRGCMWETNGAPIGRETIMFKVIG